MTKLYRITRIVLVVLLVALLSQVVWISVNAVMASYLNGEISLDDMVTQYTDFYKMYYEADQIAEKQAKTIVELETATQNLITATDKATFEYTGKNDIGIELWANKYDGKKYNIAWINSYGYTHNPEDNSYFNENDKEYLYWSKTLAEKEQEFKDLTIQLAQLYDKYGYKLDENGNLVPLEKEN